MTANEITHATKAQLDALIELCLGDPKFHEAAGLLKLASDIISEKVHEDEAPCHCYEYMGDNPKCPTHGGMFKEHGKVTDFRVFDHALTMEEIKAEYYSDYGSNYQERNDLYCTGMGC